MALQFYIFLVEPKYTGNIGSVARVMANFGLSNLILVGECPDIDENARKMAVHAQDVLREARRFDTLTEAKRTLEITASVGTTARITIREKKARRAAYGLDELPSILEPEGRVALIFGREDTGLNDQELEECDIVITIPTHTLYPSMNLSHAVVCVLYELLRSGFLDVETRAIERSRPATDEEKERLMAAFNDLLLRTNYYKERREKTVLMFRRLIGRANLTRWEYSRLLGVFLKANQYISEAIEKKEQQSGSKDE